jgi:hypothetical protein
MTADVRSSVVGRQSSRCLVILSSCRRHWPLLRFNVRGMKSSAAGLIGYYLVYAIGVRVRITRHDKGRPN